MQILVLFFDFAQLEHQKKKNWRQQQTFQYLFVTKSSSTSYVKQVIWDEITILSGVHFTV